MRHLITLFVCCLAAGAAQANDPPAHGAAAASAAPAASAKAEAPKGELAKAAEAAKAKAEGKAETKPAESKVDPSPVLIKQTAAAQLAAQRAKEEEAEAELSAKIATRLAAMRANQAARAAAAAKAKKIAELQRQRDQAMVAAALATVHPANGLPGEAGGAPRLTNAHWSYDGDTGPANWAQMNPAWSKCGTGTRQSPIDLRDGMKVDLEQIAFDYRASGFNVIDNGHTIQVGVGLGNYITVGNRTYELQQFHFHRPSEEKINGRGTEMVVHLVHKDGEGNLAVIAVLLERGAANPMLQTVWNNLPLEKNLAVNPVVALDVNEILPKKREYFTFMGSMTTPPCTENVLWMVMKQPMQASPAQMALFSRLYPLNARPIQAGGGRMIKESN
ncbi:MAG: carbonic anhydrase [Massilia sp.]